MMVMFISKLIQSVAQMAEIVKQDEKVSSLNPTLDPVLPLQQVKAILDDI